MNSELYFAATTGDNDRIIQLEDMIDQVTSEGNHTILHLAALCNKSVTVSAILVKFPQLLERMNLKNETALHLAARRGYFLVVKPLIDKSKALNLSEDFIRKANVDGDTALHLAAQNNHQNVVTEIVKADPSDTHSRNGKSETPLYLAAMRGHKDVIKIILEHCKDPPLDGPDGKTVLHAAVLSRNAEVVRLALEKKGDLINKVDSNGWTAMHHAASQNCVSLLQIIKENEATQYNIQHLPQRDIRMDNPMKKTALHIAASEGHISTVLELMRLYKDTPICAALDEDDRNILHIAVDQNHKEVVKCIIQDCPKIDELLNKRDKNGNTPLHLLVIRGTFIPELIQHPRVDRNVANNDKFTPSELLYSDENIIGDQLKIKEALEEVQNGRPRNFFWGKTSSPVLNTSESLVPSSKRSRKDAKFFMDKAKLMKEKVKLYRERTNTQIIVTALITTVTFTVGFTMPGGYHQEEGQTNQGSAVLSKKMAFNICMISDAIALLFSTSSLFLYFISSLYQDPHPVSALNAASVVLNIVSVVAMMGTFMAGTYVVLPHSTPLSFTIFVISGLFFPCVGVLLLKLIAENTVMKKLKV